MDYLFNTARIQLIEALINILTMRLYIISILLFPAHVIIATLLD
jgi:hypothetical protein